MLTHQLLVQPVHLSFHLCLDFRFDLLYLVPQVKYLLLQVQVEALIPQALDLVMAQAMVEVLVPLQEPVLVPVS